MKQFCPNCEDRTECNFVAELYECTECRSDFEWSMTGYVAHLEAEVASLKQKLAEAASLMAAHGWEWDGDEIGTAP